MTSTKDFASASVVRSDADISAPSKRAPLCSAQFVKRAERAIVSIST